MVKFTDGLISVAGASRRCQIESHPAAAAHISATTSWWRRRWGRRQPVGVVVVARRSPATASLTARQTELAEGRR